MPQPPSPTPSPAGQPDPTPPPTRAYLDAWKAGNEQSFAGLQGRFTPLLRRRIRRHPSWPALKDHWQVDDALQQLWTNALPALRTKFQHNGPGSLEAYLGRICDDTVTSLVRSHLAQKRGRGGPRPLPTDFDAAAPKPGAAAPVSPTSEARASEFAQLARAVLTDREHEAWELVELQGFTSEEAAVALDASAAAVRGLLLRARARLIARLGGDA
ncbi:MAG: sigma-70 family RNA polymerase sigma factor [Planctomycetes bacterium]|nr:sigma-70 family RNA polymerase sigma factor [Planctomycetota bacterium]